MPWNIIRTATAEDRERLNASARRFADRHGIDIGDDTGHEATWLESHIEDNARQAEPTHERPDALYLRRLWRACVRRALRHRWAEGIVRGCVGHHTD